MKIEWQIPENLFHTGSLSYQSELLMKAAPEVVERLHERFGGAVPEKLTCALVFGPVELKYKLKNGQIVKEVSHGSCTLYRNQAWVILSVDEQMGRIAIHEFLHALGIREEKVVREATKDFVNLERWTLQARNS